MTTTTKTSSLWLITGASSGLGYALARAVLEHGDRVLLTARTTAPMDELASRYPERAHVAALDVTDASQVAAVVADAEARLGGVDVLVNNAGVGYIGAVEEGDDGDVRRQFDINFFGPAAMIRAVLPGMRARGRGSIVNVSSVAGFVARPGLGYYSASKFALGALTESLWHEVEPLGLRVLLVEPGGFRTGNVARSFFAKERNPAYAATSGAFRDLVVGLGDSSGGGDPARAAEAIYAAVHGGGEAHRLVLGSDAHGGVTAKLAELRKDYEGDAVAALARSTDRVSS